MANFLEKTDDWCPLLFSILGILYVLFHFFTLEISPIPWFDETFFASITSSYTSLGKFYLSIAPTQYSEELLLYGPIYFWTTSWITQVFGFSIFTFRLTGLVASFGCIFILYKIISLYIGRRILVYLITAAFALDSLFNANMHSGRMDSLALFFALLSIYLYFKASNKIKYPFSPRYIVLVFSGLFFSLALLTTPRIGILLLALGAMQLFYLLKDFNIANILKLIVFWGIIISIYLIWIFSAFGSIDNFLIYYAGFTEYLGTSFVFPKQQIPLMTITFASFALGILINYKEYLSSLIILSAFSVLFFYVLVNDTGQYSVIIAPFQYTIIAMAVVTLLKSERNKSKVKTFLYSSPLIAILIFNAAFFTLKGLTLYIASETRNPRYITGFLQSQLLPNTNVIGDEAYYYAVSNAGANFQYISIFKDLHEREKHQRLIYDYDYIIWSDKLQREQPHLLEVYRKNSKLVEVARFSHNGNKKLPLVTKILNSLNVPVNHTYNGTLYERIK